jgi:hypothetical protein
MKDKKVKLKVHEWVRGILDKKDELFNSLEDALSSLKERNFDNAKVYDKDGNLIKSTSKRRRRHDSPYC